MASVHESELADRKAAAQVARTLVWMPNVLVILLLIDLALLAAHLLSFAMFGRVFRLVNLDAENNLPTWWSSAQLLLAGVTIGILALRNARVSPAAASLTFLALLMLALSLDETSSVHEKVGFLVDSVLGDRKGTTFHRTGLWFAVVGIPFAALVVLLLRRLSNFLADVPGSGTRLLTGFAVLLAGAVAVEGATNLLVPEGLGRGAASHGLYVALVGLEEFLEMCGGSLLLWSSLGLFRNHWSTRSIAVELRPLTAAEAGEYRVA